MTIHIDDTDIHVSGWRDAEGNIYGILKSEFTLAISAANGSPALGIVEGFSMPFAFEVYQVYASCIVPDATDPLEIQLRRNGTAMLSTTLTIDATETNSLDSAVQPVLIGAQSHIPAKTPVSIEVLNTNISEGVKVTLLYKRHLTINGV